jgi:uncharacterized membrane protein
VFAIDSVIINNIAFKIISKIYAMIGIIFVVIINNNILPAINTIAISSDAQRSSVWRSVAKASAERPDFAERERALERLTPER